MMWKIYQGVVLFMACDRRPISHTVGDNWHFICQGGIKEYIF